MKNIKTCRACDSSRLTPFLDLGEQYLSDFRRDDTKTPKYPIKAIFCEDCTLVQLDFTTPQAEMYHDRYGFKSGVSDSIKKDLDSIVLHAFQYVNDPGSWLDIASNDGTLLSFVPDLPGWKIGVDPVSFLCKEADALNMYGTYIVNDYFSAEAVPVDEFDVITSVSCFYDMPDPNKFVSDVKSVLAAKGVWVIQQNYLLTTMELSAVDNFCHEHIEYYTLYSLEKLLNKHGLEVNEVYLSDVNGGSIRTIVSHQGTFDIDQSVYTQRMAEDHYGVTKAQTYHDFASRVFYQLNRLRRVLTELKDEGKRTVILAASTRGATIWQSAEIGPELVEAAVERNPAKVGAMFTAVGIPIISEEEFRAGKFDYAIIGPWFFADEIISREKDYVMGGGQLIKPLPEVKVIGKDYFRK